MNTDHRMAVPVVVRPIIIESTPPGAPRITSANLADHLVWECGTDIEEFRDGRERGVEVALELADRRQILHVCEGLDHGPVEFVRRLQLARPEVDPDMPLSAYCALEFGPVSGGLRGHYARGFRDGFAKVRSLLSLH